MEFSWDLLRKLDEQYGDSFFYVDVEAFESNFHQFLGAFRKIYPNTRIGYSYKTNYLPRLCQRVLAMGGYAEVVSRMEYDLARRVGVPPDQIIFNGPYKTADDLERALLEGSICNLDSAAELDVVERVAAQAPDRSLTVALRCNIDIETSRVSRFGFEVETPEFRQALERLRRVPNCNLAGLHFHASTGHRSVDSYALRTKRMLELSVEHFPGTAPRFINMGGGFFSKMSSALRRQFTDPIPQYEDYAQAIASQVAATYPDGSGPELIVEPGSALTADVMTFVARIMNVKQVRSRSVALASGSIHNIKPTLHGKNMPMTIIGTTQESAREEYAEIDVVGYTCMEHDVLSEKYSGRLGPGDYALFGNVGAYTIVMKPPFIRPAPCIITRDRGADRFEVLKRREEIDDVFATYTF
jgi:diaminopimelate decarboxylase